MRGLGAPGGGDGGTGRGRGGGGAELLLPPGELYDLDAASLQLKVVNYVSREKCHKDCRQQGETPKGTGIP